MGITERLLLESGRHAASGEGSGGQQHTQGTIGEGYASRLAGTSDRTQRRVNANAITTSPRYRNHIEPKSGVRTPEASRTERSENALEYVRPEDDGSTMGSRRASIVVTNTMGDDAVVQERLRWMEDERMREQEQEEQRVIREIGEIQRLLVQRAQSEDVYQREQAREREKEVARQNLRRIKETGICDRRRRRMESGCTLECEEDMPSFVALTLASPRGAPSGRMVNVSGCDMKTGCNKDTRGVSKTANRMLTDGWIHNLVSVLAEAEDASEVRRGRVTTSRSPRGNQDRRPPQTLAAIFERGPFHDDTIRVLTHSS
jgi:hypothetical protein